MLDAAFLCLLSVGAQFVGCCLAVALSENSKLLSNLLNLPLASALVVVLTVSYHLFPQPQTALG